MSQGTLTSGPGVPVRDALAPELLDMAAVTSTQTGSWTEVPFPGPAQVELALGAITGTGVTVDVEIEFADDASGTNPVSAGHFDSVTETSDSETRVLEIVSYKRYARAVATIAGTTPVVTATVTVRNPDSHRGDVTA